MAQGAEERSIVLEVLKPYQVPFSSGNEFQFRQLKVTSCVKVADLVMLLQLRST
jgi:hypothetical protein